jgi:hypothetical protein
MFIKLNYDQSPSRESSVLRPAPRVVSEAAVVVTEEER